MKRRKNPSYHRQLLPRRSMGRKKNGRGKRRVKKKQIAAGEEAEPEAQAEPSFPHIPAEIVVGIVSRLPLRSLPRFACVSKRWRSLVSDVVPKITGRKMVLIQSIDFSERSGLGPRIIFHSIDEGSRVQRVSKPRKKNAIDYPYLFSGSCNGLLLINIEDGLFLWNPVTQYFKKVLSHKYLAKGSRSHMALGLCYDSSTHEYKAVMGHSYQHSSDGGKFVHVGSFRNRSWTRVQLPYNLHTVRSGPIVNGHQNWHVSDLKSFYDDVPSWHHILYFNPHTNQFGKVPMPEAMNWTNGNIIFGLGVLDGCLSMVCHDNSSHSEAKGVEVLAMEEYGIENSWTKLFSISNLALVSFGTLEPLCYTKDGEVLVRLVTRSRNEKSLWVYNPTKSLLSKSQVEPTCRMIDVIMYEESLVGPTEELIRGRSTYVQHYDNGPPRKWRKMSNGQWRYFEID